MQLSKSKVNCYEFCPKRFYWEYIEERKPPKLPAMQRGIDIHEIVAKSLTEIVRTKATDYHEIKSIVQTFAGNRYDEYRTALLNFIDYEFTRNKALTPLFSEIRIEFGGVHGILDRVDVDLSTQIYHVYDYKTGVGKLKTYKFELAFYGYLFKQFLATAIGNEGVIDTLSGKMVLPVSKQVKIGVINLDSRTIYSKVLEQHEVDEALAKVSDVALKIKDGKDAEYPTNLKNCKFCPCKQYCWGEI